MAYAAVLHSARSVSAATCTLTAAVTAAACAGSEEAAQVGFVAEVQGLLPALLAHLNTSPRLIPWLQCVGAFSCARWYACLHCAGTRPPCGCYFTPLFASCRAGLKALSVTRRGSS
jgi:hypothetical protein